MGFIGWFNEPDRDGDYGKHSLSNEAMKAGTESMKRMKEAHEKGLREEHDKTQAELDG